MSDRRADLEFADEIIENEKGGKIENGCPQYRLEWRQYLGRNDRGNRDGGIMESVDVVEKQRQYDDNEQQGHGLWLPGGKAGL